MKKSSQRSNFTDKVLVTRELSKSFIKIKSGIYPIPPLRAGSDRGSIFKQRRAGLDLELQLVEMLDIVKLESKSSDIKQQQEDRRTRYINSIYFELTELQEVIFLSLRVFEPLSSSLLLFPQRFGRYVLRNLYRTSN